MQFNCEFDTCLPLVSIQVYVLKRPHVDEFLKRMGELFECVLFTASLSKVRLPEYQMYINFWPFFSTG